MEKLNPIKNSIEISPNPEGEKNIFTKELQGMSYSDFIEFLSRTKETQTDYFSSEENTNAILEKYFSLSESLEKSNKANFQKQSDLTNWINFAISLEANKLQQNNKPATVSFDNSFQSIIKLYQKYPEAVRKFWSIFGQSAHMVDSKILVDGIAKINASYDFDQDFKIDTLHIFNLIYSVHGKGKDLDKIILSKLDFDQPENFSQTGIFLNFLKRLHSVSEDFIFSASSQNDIKQLLQKIIADNKGSYLLNLRAKDLLLEIDGGINKESGSLQYKIAPGIKAQYRDDEEKVYIQNESQEMRPLNIADIKAIKDSEATEENEETMLDFTYLSNLKIRKHITNDIGIDISGISLSEQAYFLKMLKDKTYQEMDPIKNFVKNYGKNGFKSFLTLEIDKNSGERILEIGKNLNSENANLIFAKTAEIIDLAEKESEELTDIFFKSGNGNVDMPKVKYELLKKANEITVRLSEKIGGRKVNIEEYISDIDNSKAEIMLLYSAIKSAKTQGLEIDWENIKDFNFDIKDFINDLDEGTKKEMLTVAERNWRQNEKLKDVVVGGLKESLGNSQNQKWYVCKFQGKIVSFVRFEKTNHGTLYAGSFNVDPEARGVGVGEEMMNRALIEEGKKNILEATASPRNVVGTCYVEKVGFVLDGYIADYHKTSEPLFNMQLDKEKNKKYVYRNEGKENKIDEEQIKKQCWTQENLDQIVGAETIILKFDMKNEFEKMNSVMQNLLVAKDDSGKNVEGQNLENKYVVTRYFQDNKEDKNNHTRYFVLEKI